MDLLLPLGPGRVGLGLGRTELGMFPGLSNGLRVLSVLPSMGLVR